MDKSNPLWLGISEDSYTEIEIALTDCLSRLSSLYGLNNVTNHQYLRLISFILLHQKFHQPCIKYSIYLNAYNNINFEFILALLPNLLQSMLGALQKFTCPETISLCRFTPDLWIKLLKHAKVTDHRISLNSNVLLLNFFTCVGCHSTLTYHLAE
jgi:hypothetical protein